ncbi:hypothetical protein EJ02DRAFT_417686 [Clathrospora elynae]|uniref:Uncharacterized protein n=1 Tax=Clathrospora elynae TaxID=706981 RepID=A0A6A5T5Q1_9PLEO|nr:hypothetical protein EJ02DRAFT_417686 [Clathrospora elynae]
MVDRSHKTVGADGAIVALNSVHSFYLDPASHSGKSELFSNDITKVAALADEILSLVTPWILFVFDSLGALCIFAEAFSAHAVVCIVLPNLWTQCGLKGFAVFLVSTLNGYAN